MIALRRFCASDPAGGNGKDSWTARVVALDGENIVDWALLEIRPPFNTTEAADQVATFAKRFGCSRIHGDKYAGAWPADALAKHGITYQPLDLSTSDIYRECVPLFSAGRIKLLDHARTITQLRMLERRTRPGGRDSFDHAPGAHDDLAASLCAAAWLASCHRVPKHDQVVVFASDAFRDGRASGAYLTEGQRSVQVSDFLAGSVTKMPGY